MNFVRISIVVLSAFAISSCEQTTESRPVGSAEHSTDSLDSSLGRAPGVMQPCALGERSLEGNSFTARKAGLQLFIAADSTTFDPDLGESHRILEVYEAGACQLVDRVVLPVNVSPDFPYYFAEIIYNNTSRLVGIKGFNRIYCYDLEQRRMLPPLEPQFLLTRKAEDAQTGMIKRLEVWENYLIGFAEDQGVFVFNLSEPDAPAAVLPLAEFPLGADNSFHSLFLLPSNPDTLQQVVIPEYHSEDNSFFINPLLHTPLPIQPVKSNKQTGRDRYMVFTHPSNGKTIAIDLKEAKLHELSKEQKNMNPEVLLKQLQQ